MFKTYIKRFFLLNLNEYQNLDVNLYINVLLLGAFVGMAIAVCLVASVRSKMALMTKQLLRHGAIGEQNAKSLSDLGLKDVKFLKSMLSRDGQLTKIVRRVGEVRYTYEEYVALMKEKGVKPEKIDFNTAAFYIDESQQARAKYVYETYSSPWPKTLALCVFLLAAYVCLSLVMPEILSWLNSLIG